MAFGARELRLILSIQSYGTGNIQRLRRDILGLNNSVKAANASQMAVQDQVLRKWQQIGTAERKIQSLRMDHANKAADIERKAADSAFRFSQARAGLAARESKLLDDARKKRLSISNTEARLRKMQPGGSGALGMEARMASAQVKGNALALERGALFTKQIGLQGTLLGEEAKRLNIETRVRGMLEDENDWHKFIAGDIGEEQLQMQALYKQYQASLVATQRIDLSIRNINKEVGHWQAKLSGLTSQERKLLAEIDEQAALELRINETLAIRQSELARIEAQLKGITAQEGALSAAEKAATVALERQREILHLITGEIQMQEGEVAKLIAEYETLNGVIMKGATAEDVHRNKMDRLMRREMKIRTAAHVARTAQFGGLIGVAAFGAAASSFASFNKQVTLAATQARGIERPLSDIPILTKAIQDGVHGAGVEIEGIIDLMKQFPATGDEMAKASYDIFSSMDISFGGGMKLLKTFNQLAVATGSDLATATDAGITVMNNFGKASGTTAQKLNLMVTTIRFGRMRLEDLNAMLEKVAPAATASGQRLQDVAGAMVAITRLQPSQRVGATGIARLLQTFRDPDFQKGVFKASKGIADITKGGGATGNLKALPEIIKTMAESFGLFAAQGGPGELFKRLTALGHGSGIGRQSRIEAINAYTFLIGHVQKYLELQGKATGDTKEFGKALKAMSESPGVRWEVMINQFRALILVIGEAAIPALLKFVGWIAKLANWFTSLDSGMRKLVVGIGVGASAFALFGGTIMSIATAAFAAYTNFQIWRLATVALGTDAETSAKKIGMLGGALKGLMGLGIISIPIIMQLIKGGDPSGWALIGGALAGAAGGAMIGGLPGAAIGAITVPIVMEIMGDIQGPKDAAHKAYNAYIKQLSTEDDKHGTFWEKLNPFARAGGIKGAKSFDDWLKLNPQFKKKAKDDENVLKKYYNTLNAQGKEAYKKAMAQQNNVDNLMKQGNDKLSEAQKKELALRKAHLNAVQQAQQKQKELVKSAVDNLSQIYDQLRQQNQEAFGALGQGPVMSGIMGSVFTGLNDLLRQFGVQIPIPFQIIKKDLDMQVTYFKRFQKDINQLEKKGAPPALIEQIQAMGPEKGIPFAEGIIQGGKKGFKGYFKEWQNIQKMIDEQTQKDLNRKLKYWNKYGKDAAFAMVTGLSSSLQTAGLRNKFAKMIHNTFGAQLAKQLKKDVAVAYNNAVKDYDTANPPGTGGAGAGGPTPLKLKPSQVAAANLFKTKGELKRLSGGIGVAGSIAQALFAADQPGSRGGRRHTAEETADVQRLINRQTMLRAQAKRQQHALAVSTRRESILSQMHKQDKRNPGGANYTITYGGVTTTIHTGATVADVIRALRRQRFTNRNKVHRGGGGPHHPGGSG